MKICILAPGPSMSQALADSLRSENCIAVSNVYQLAPWAMALCAQDHAWWRLHRDAKDFAGRRFSGNKIDGVEQLCGGTIRRDSSSGVLALEAARRLGATEIELHGYDNRGTHYFGRHPAPLRNTSPTRFVEFENQLRTLGAQMKKEGIRIINKTPNSALECFERG